MCNVAASGLGYPHVCGRRRVSAISHIYVYCCCLCMLTYTTPTRSLFVLFDASLSLRNKSILGIVGSRQPSLEHKDKYPLPVTTIWWQKPTCKQSSDLTFSADKTFVLKQRARCKLTPVAEERCTLFAHRFCGRHSPAV